MKPLGRELDPRFHVGTREHAEIATAHRDPRIQDVLQWLTFSHLPLPLQRFSRPFYEAAVELIVEIRTDSDELFTALTRLTEAKDSAVRAGIRNDTGRAGSVPRPQTVVVPPSLNPADYFVDAVLDTVPEQD